LKDIPQEDWDGKRLRQPQPVEGFPSLQRGLGGLLPTQTPRELAQNMLAAAILNRLCGNLLIWVACAARMAESGRQVTPEEKVAVAARAAVRTQTSDLQHAKAEEQAASRELSDFQASYTSDAARQHYLDSFVGWKSSARGQAERDLEAARKELQAAEEALIASRRKVQVLPWHSQWPSPVPQQAAERPIFAVRLTAKAPILRTIKDFLDAMENGLIDRSGGSGIVTKHNVEAAFVRHACDVLMLCSSEAGEAEAGKVYTHMPMPVTTSAGFLMPNSGREITAPRPHHDFQLKIRGQTFPFDVARSWRPQGPLASQPRARTRRRARRLGTP